MLRLIVLILFSVAIPITAATDFREDFDDAGQGHTFASVWNEGLSDMEVTEQVVTHTPELLAPQADDVMKPVEPPLVFPAYLRLPLERDRKKKGGVGPIYEEPYDALDN